MPLLSPSVSESSTSASPYAAPPSWAAVSYVFEDALWCDWLFHEFDGLRVPRPLINRPSRHGRPYPDRISMTPDPSDPEQLDCYPDAMRQAQHLILVISPSSGRSELVNDHLRIFRGLTDGERIIAIVVKGDPGCPSAEPASESDKEWLPSCLQWRFDGRNFAEAERTEPLVIDARMGVSTLSEVRTRLLAAMLEVEEERLGELGSVPRHSIRPVIYSPVPDAAPENADDVVVVRKPAEGGGWKAALIAACAVIAGFAFWWLPSGAMDEPVVPAAWVPQPVNLPGSSGPREEVRLVTVKAVAPVALPDPPTAIVQVPREEKPAQPPAPALVARVATGTTTLVPETESPEFRSVVERRDRMFFLGEARMRAGGGEEAYDIFKQAAEVAAIAIRRSDATPEHVLRAAEIHRRIGQLAVQFTTPLEGREQFEKARQLIQQVRAKGPIGSEGAHLLVDVEGALRKLSSQ
ncbi:MAG: hypothetical protein RL088_394 [Verrucomicrobiota bacterium]|jgi:hypothetical protein